MGLLQFTCFFSGIILFVTASNGISRDEFEKRLLEVTLFHTEEVSSLKREVSRLKEANILLGHRVKQLEDIVETNDKHIQDIGKDGTSDNNIHITANGDTIVNVDLSKDSGILTKGKPYINTNMDDKELYPDIDTGKESMDKYPRPKKQVQSKNVQTETKSLDVSQRYLLDQSASNPVAFSVVINASGISGLGMKQTIHFDKIVTNVGDAFDIRLGVFTAPVSGLYTFSLTMMARPSEAQSLHVVKDGTRVFHVYASGKDYSTDSKTMVLQVDQGQEIWVETSDTTGLSDTVHGWEFTSFTGFLLYTAGVA